MSARRDVSPLLQIIRNILQHRPNTNFLRFRDEISARSQPQPNLPDGVNHKLNNNYYYTRDARREVTPNCVVYEGDTVPQLEESTSAQTPSPNNCIPGKVYLWDS